MATILVDNTGNTQSIVPRIVPVEAQYAAGRTLTTETPGSTSENSGGQTGQLYPR